jgi:imidazolonepropionase-like amidohydrolase
MTINHLNSQRPNVRQASHMPNTIETKTLCLCASVALFVAATAAQAPAARVVAIRGGTVMTVTKGTIPNGVVVLRDGKIAAVGGAGTTIPAGAETVDATGRFVTPGIIDAHSHIAADSINEGGTTVSSMTGIEDVLDPTDINVFRDLAGGLTVANVLHGSANPIGGKNTVIKLRWGKVRPSEMVFEGAMPGIKFALGENPKDMRFGGGGQQQPPRRYPSTRAAISSSKRSSRSSRASGSCTLTPIAPTRS